MIKAIVPSPHEYILVGSMDTIAAAASLLKQECGANQVGMNPHSGSLVMHTPRPLSAAEIAVTRAVAA